MSYPYNEVYVKYIEKVEALSKPTVVIIDPESNGDENDKEFIYSKDTKAGELRITLRIGLTQDMTAICYIYKVSALNGSIEFDTQCSYGDENPNENLKLLSKSVTEDLDETLTMLRPLDELTSESVATDMIKLIKDAIVV